MVKSKNKGILTIKEKHEKIFTQDDLKPEVNVKNMLFLKQNQLEKLLKIHLKKNFLVITDR